MKLSILIPSLACRPQFLAELLASLSKQVTNGVEVLVSIDNADKQIGVKRNELMNRATGEYIVFIDDDDKVSDNYIEEVMKGIESGSDYIGYTQVFHDVVKNYSATVVSTIGTPWGESGGVYTRGVQHICPIKRSLAIQYQFPDKSFGEDREWGYAMDKIAQTQYTISTPMYFYEYRQFKLNETTNGNKQ